jgi:hypothetical protein
MLLASFAIISASVGTIGRGSRTLGANARGWIKVEEDALPSIAGATKPVEPGEGSVARDMINGRQVPDASSNSRNKTFDMLPNGLRRKDWTAVMLDSFVFTCPGSTRIPASRGFYHIPFGSAAQTKRAPARKKHIANPLKSNP